MPSAKAHVTSAFRFGAAMSWPRWPPTSRRRSPRSPRRSARGEESDRIVGLRLGADDYVVKPFSAGELIARVDAILRRLEPARDEQPPLRFDGLEIDPAGRRVLRDGEELELTQLEFELLLFLARHPGQAFTREQLMDNVWQYTFYVDTSTVTVHVRRLRAKVEPDPANPRFIQTVWGVGYRFAS